MSDQLIGRDTVRSLKRTSTDNSSAGNAEFSSEVLASAGTLEVRLTQSRGEVQLAQELRYQVFYQEMNAQACDAIHASRQDADHYDEICDHLIVVDTAASNSDQIVATYRLLPQDVAELCGGFYSASEFDIAPILKRFSDLRFLELGRSCVREQYRSKRTMELMWHGLWTYVRQRGFNVMFGCASLVGTNVDKHADVLRLIQQQSAAPAQWRASGLLGRGIDVTQYSGAPENPRAAFAALPPLVKAYMRLGAYVSSEVVVDHQFNTTDILIMLPVAVIRKRYFEKFGKPDEKQSRASSSSSEQTKDPEPTHPISR